MKMKISYFNTQKIPDCMELYKQKMFLFVSVIIISPFLLYAV